MTDTTPKQRPTPLTVLGGFLGAGKTTLLNRLLRDGQRYAVLVNDFGDVNVDASLIRSSDGLTMQLENGCICCSLVDGFTSALERVLDQSPRPLAIIVEASGVGDPWRIAEFAMVEPTLTLGSVVGMIDAPEFLRQLEDPLIGDTVASQLRRADLILLNKVDLCDAATVDAVQQRVRELIPGVRLVPCSHAEVPDELILVTEDREEGSGGGLRPPVSHDHARHDDQFRRYTFRSAAALERARLESALDALPPAVLRVKGVCRLTDSDAPWLVQVVGRRRAITPLPEGARPLAEGTVLSLIGTVDLPPEEVLEGQLAAARAEGSG